jgi:GT2 family glycosyltransferase
LHVLRNAQNEGFSKAVNQAIRAAGYRHVLLLNNDCFVSPGCVERLVWLATRHERIAAAGPLSSDWGRHSLRHPDTVARVGANPRILRCLTDPVAAAAFLDQQHRFAVQDRLAFFCTLLHREAVRDVGLLDERFHSGLHADDEWCLRSGRLRWRCIMAWNAFAVHLQSRTFARLGLEYNRLFGEGSALLRQVAG